MSLALRRLYPLSALAIAIALLGVSCNDPSLNPQLSDARASLQTALEAWRSGKSPRDLESAQPPIHIIESEWTNGQKLSEFQILREEPSDADKRFAVKLVRGAPASKEEEVTYIVLGSGSLSIFRDKDYERTMNMDNNPVPKKKRR